jgi:hypothetical protein
LNRPVSGQTSEPGGFMRTGDVLSFSKITPLDVQNDMVYSGVFMEIAF